MSKIYSWSLSTLQTYEQCPYKLKKIKIDKVSCEPSYALQYGIQVHQKMEQFLKGNITGVPKELSKFSVEMNNLKKNKAIPEEELVLDSHWNPITDKNKWKHKNAWWRGKTDARVDNLVVDLKTGRHYDTHEDQANLYAIAIMKHFPEYSSIDVEFWHSKSGDVHSYEYFRSDLNDMIDIWDSRVRDLFREKHFLPKENEWCKYCEFKTSCPLNE